MAKLLTFLCVVSFISTALACSSALSDDTDLTTAPAKYSDSSAPYSVTSTLPKEKLGSSEGTPRELEAVWEAWALLNKEHIDRASFEPGAFEESAIKGLIDSVEDTHTSYVDPLVLQIEQTDLSGQFEGIGAHVRRREDGMIQIISPIEGGPAEAAGILAGDIIIEFDGELIDQMKELPLIVAQTEVGKTVTVKLWRNKKEI